MNVQAKPFGTVRSSTGRLRSTSHAQLDEMIERLTAGATTFAKLTLDERIALAQAMQRGAT